MTRHSVIALREEARRLIQALGRAVFDPELETADRLMLVRQMTLDLEDVRRALLELGGREALETITS